MFKRKAKQTKEETKDINFDQLVIGSFYSGRTGPIFQISSTKGIKMATLSDSIEYMCELGAMQVIDETGLNLAMISLCINESLTVNDSEFKEIKVTRIS